MTIQQGLRETHWTERQPSARITVLTLGERGRGRSRVPS